MERKFNRQVAQAQKEAEKRFRAQLAEMRDKVETLDKIEIERSRLKLQMEKVQKDNEQMRKKIKSSDLKIAHQDKQNAALQKKLDDLFERQKLEKENARLITKYEIEQESSKVINDLGFQIRELEEALRVKEREN